MEDQAVVQLLNLSTGKVIAQLNDAQLKLLKAHLEQESATDTNFFIAPETVDWMRGEGAGELADRLKAVLGDSEELAVGLAPILSDAPGRVQGRLLTLETKAPLVGYKVEAYDVDVLFDDFLGWGYTDPEGRFEIRFEESAFKDRSLGVELEGDPEVKLRILDRECVPLGADAEDVPVGGGAKVLVSSVGIVRAMETDFGDIYVSQEGKVVAPVLDDAAAICPQCGATYRSGFETCSDCNVPLHHLV